MKGIYVLLMELPKSQKIRIGILGTLAFKKGLYAYAGSAQAGLEQRMARHRRKEKALHWHIDYFLQKARILDFYVKNAPKAWECRTAREFLKKFIPVPGFGCSDCSCVSHMFFLG